MSDIKPIDQKLPVRSDAAAKAKPQADRGGAPAGGENASVNVDSVEISRDAHSLRQLQSRIQNLDSFDQERVNSIKQAIQNGEYPVDSNRLAEKFLDLESQLNQ